jgi:hypothetical protein
MENDCLITNYIANVSSLNVLYDNTNTCSGLDRRYELVFTKVNLCSASPIAVRLKQSIGPTLDVECNEFIPESSIQVHVRQQHASGWHSAKTTPYGLSGGDVSIVDYIRRCMRKVWFEVINSKTPVGLLFRLGWEYRKVSNSSI